VFDSDRRHLIAYLAAAAVLIVIAAQFFGRGGGSAPAPSISMAAPAAPKPARARPREPAVALIWVDVAGAVRRPGLYSLPKDARVAAAITRAEGFRRGANSAAINLAARLSDGQQIFVPRRGPGGETPAAGAAAGSGAVAGASGATTGTGGAGAAGVGASGAGASGGAGAGGAGAASGAGSAGAPISLSTASQAELEQLDGVGPALAQRIIQYREQHGGFRSIEELQEVSGIGPKRFEALKGAVSP
jgi:competence protein ComEA